VNIVEAAFIAGLLSGIISPIILSVLQHQVIWKKQKKLEIKFMVFQDSLRALSLWATDALDLKLQAGKCSYGGIVRVTEARSETWELIEKTRSMVQSFYSSETYSAYDTALKAEISLQRIPNEDFESKRTIAILAMARELGIK
jgi:hypothetical protein